MDANFCRNKRFANRKTFSAHARSKKHDSGNIGESFAVYGSACDGKCDLKSKRDFIFVFDFFYLFSSTASLKTTFIATELRLTKSLLRYSNLKTSK